MVGYIHLWRELLKKPIWLKSTPEQRSVLIAILLMANFDENEWEWKGEKFKVEPGQFITSLESIRKKSGKGISTQNVRSSLKRFEKLEFLTNKSTKQGRLISIINWQDYQSSKNCSQHSTQQRPNKEATKTQHLSNKERKKEGKNKDMPQKTYEFYISEIRPFNKTRKRALKNIKKWLNKNSYDDLIQAIKNYKTVSEEYEPRYRKDPANFFGVNEVFHIDYLPENFTPKEDKCKTPAWM